MKSLLKKLQQYASQLQNAASKSLQVKPQQSGAQVANSAALKFAMITGILVISLMPEVAMAAPWDNAANKVLEIMTGGLARTLAILAVVACGVMAMFGKLSWDWAIKIVIGIVLIFGATTVVDMIIGASRS